MEIYEKKLVIEGVNTLRQLTEKDEFWIKSEEEGRDVLVQHKYQQAFPFWKNNSSWTTEASRASALVKMHQLDLAQRLAEHEWSCLFPTIVANEKTKQVLSPASSEDNPHGTLRVVYREMQATSPVVPNRKFNVLRSCTQIDQATWLIAEISHQSIESITFAINQTVGRVKQALEKHQPPSPGGDWPTEKQQVGAEDIASELLQDELRVLKLN
ncbi:START domain-containing protein [Tanacetum coccineum]